METTLTSLRQVPPERLELFRMLGATRAQALWRLKLPTGLPGILAGLRVAVVLALVGAVVGEFIGASRGLGALVIATQGIDGHAAHVRRAGADRGAGHARPTSSRCGWSAGCCGPYTSTRLRTRLHEDTTCTHPRALLARLPALHRLAGLERRRRRSPDKITVAGWSKPITEVMPLLVDEDKGFYRAQGIDLAYVPGAGGGDAIRNILSGQADVAFTDPGSLLRRARQGREAARHLRHLPAERVQRGGAEVQRHRAPADLKGKRIGVYSLASGTRQNLLVLLHQAGLAESDVTVVVTGLLNFAPLLQGQVDATAATDTGLLVGRRRGLRRGERDRGGPVPQRVERPVRRARRGLRRRAPALRRFLRAYRDAAAWMIAQPEEAARLAVVARHRRQRPGAQPARSSACATRRAVSALTQKQRARRHGRRLAANRGRHLPQARA